MLTEEEWRRLKEEGYPEHLIKKEDAKRTREIDAALKRTVLPQNTAAFLQGQCKWVCHQIELRIVLVGKVMVDPSFYGQLSNTATFTGSEYQFDGMSLLHVQFFRTAAHYKKSGSEKVSPGGSLGWAPGFAPMQFERVFCSPPPLGAKSLVMTFSVEVSPPPANRTTTPCTFTKGLCRFPPHVQNFGAKTANQPLR